MDFRGLGSVLYENTTHMRCVYISQRRGLNVYLRGSIHYYFLQLEMTNEYFRTKQQSDQLRSVRYCSRAAPQFTIYI